MEDNYIYPLVYYAILCMLFPYSVRPFMNASVLTFVYFLSIALQSCIIAFACFLYVVWTLLK